MAEQMEYWIIKIYRKFGPDGEERLLAEVPVPDGRWQNATHAILSAWRTVPPFQVRAEVYDPRNLFTEFTYDELDYPDKIEKS